MSWRAHVIGIGMGAPGHLTADARAAIAECDLFLVPDKGDATSELVDARQGVVESVRGSEAEGGYRFVRVVDPERPSDGDPDKQRYRAGVAAWRRERAMRNVEQMRQVGGDGVVGFLAWGDPAFFDSTIKMVSDINAVEPLDFDVIPGLAAFQILAAEAKVGLNTIGSAVHITPGRRLVEEWDPRLGTVVVMLDSYLKVAELAEKHPDVEIVWGAYLGLPQQRIIRGRLADVIGQIVDERAAMREQHGWVMDTYALYPRGL